MDPSRITQFWLDECSPSDWYKQDAAFDQAIRDEFKQSWDAALNGAYGLWLTYPTGALAYLILTDQLSRNIFRGQGAAFATDRLALAAAKKAIHLKWDRRIDGLARQFFYMPLMHSECLTDQDRCVRLMQERLNDDSNLLHARAHREIIRLFGRFPYRNAALGRRNTPAEEIFLSGDGYGGILRQLDKACV